MEQPSFISGESERPPEMPKTELPEDATEKREKIEKCQSFGELYGVIEEMGVIRGRSGDSSAAEVIGIIKTIEGGAGILLDHVTSTYGLRAKVKELFREKYPEATHI